jgi:hypothetical protein
LGVQNEASPPPPSMPVPQTFDPPPPQNWPVGHSPPASFWAHEAVSPPHPSLWTPHVPAGKSAHVFGVQYGAPSGDTAMLPPHLLYPAPPQYSVPLHEPQSMTPPHVSPFIPHV